MMKNLARSTFLIVLAAGLIGAACAKGNADQTLSSSDAPGAHVEVPTLPSADQQVEKLPYLSPHGGPPGTEVTVTMTNLPLGDTVEVGFGSFVEHQIIGSGRPDSNGGMKTTVTVPASSAPGPYYFFIANSAGSPIAVSDPFLVTRADGTVRLRGQVADAGTPCKVMKGINDELYGLFGKVGTPAVGARITVEGKLAATSACKQTLAIEVTSLQVEP
jgi:hypothetical protein